MCRWRPPVLATGFCGLVAWGASAQTLTEEQALARMRMEHPQIRVLRFTVREVEAAARERSLLANPTVSYTREDAGLNVDDFLLVTQELPVRRRLGLLGEAGEQAVNAAQARADNAIDAIIDEINEAASETDSATEAATNAADDAKELAQLTEVTQADVDAADAAADLAEAQSDAAIESIIEAAQALNLAQLNETLGLNLDAYSGDSAAALRLLFDDDISAVVSGGNLVTISGTPQEGDQYTVTVEDTDVTYTVTGGDVTAGLTLAGLRTKLVDAINTDGVICQRTGWKTVLCLLVN